MLTEIAKTEIAITEIVIKVYYNFGWSLQFRLLDPATLKIKALTANLYTTKTVAIWSEIKRTYQAYCKNDYFQEFELTFVHVVYVYRTVNVLVCPLPVKPWGTGEGGYRFRR